MKEQGGRNGEEEGQNRRGLKRMNGTNETYRRIILGVGVKNVGEDQDKSFTCGLYTVPRVYTPTSRCISDTLTKLRAENREITGKDFSGTNRRLMSKTCNRPTFFLPAV